MKFLFLLCICFFSISNDKHTTRLELPYVARNENVIIHKGYSFVYSQKHKQSKWVAYKLTRIQVQNSNVKRNNTFTRDPFVRGIVATNSDYVKSGFDKGHLAPAVDMAWSEQTMSESFYFSNISPQKPGFNRGIWKRLEERIRTWALEYDSIYVVTGPILTDTLQTIGKNRISVPQLFYKVILNYSKTGYNGIGFILPNTSTSEPLQHFAVTIDSVEHVSGIDFFSSLPDPIENKVESTLCISCWIWNDNKANKTK